MTGDDVRIGRLAMREEDNKWVAYYARPDTMDGAAWLGAVHVSIASNPFRRQQFLNMMTDIVADILEQLSGRRPDMRENEQEEEYEHEAEEEE